MSVVRSAQRYRVVNTTRGTVLAERAEMADRFLRRGLGLMGRRSLSEGDGLIIKPCNSVVSFFMRFPIDVIFVGPDDRVRHVVRHLRPWRASRIVKGSRLVIELPSGTSASTGTLVGDQIDITTG
jgi:uncharacterized membrane protein (UPF0127 family)